MKYLIKLVIILMLYSTQLSAQTITKEETAFFDAIIEAKTNPKEYKLLINNYSLAKCLNDETLADSDNKLIIALKKIKNNDELRNEFYGLVNYYYSSDRNLIYDAFVVIKYAKEKRIIITTDESIRFVLSQIIATSTYKINYHTLSDSLYITVEGNKDEILVSAEENAQYPGGEKALMEFIRTQINYPLIEKSANITGKVLIMFVVEKNGAINNIKVLKKVSPGIDHEGMRVIKMMPLWKPAYNEGRPVRQWYNIPINFSLQ